MCQITVRYGDLSAGSSRSHRRGIGELLVLSVELLAGQARIQKKKFREGTAFGAKTIGPKGWHATFAGRHFTFWRRHSTFGGRHATFGGRFLHSEGGMPPSKSDILPSWSALRLLWAVSCAKYGMVPWMALSWVPPKLTGRARAQCAHPWVRPCNGP